MFLLTVWPRPVTQSCVTRIKFESAAAAAAVVLWPVVRLSRYFLSRKSPRRLNQCKKNPRIFFSFFSSQARAWILWQDGSRLSSCTTYYSATESIWRGRRKKIPKPYVGWLLDCILSEVWLSIFPFFLFSKNTVHAPGLDYFTFIYKMWTIAHFSYWSRTFCFMLCTLCVNVYSRYDLRRKDEAVWRNCPLPWLFGSISLGMCQSDRS